EHHPGFSKIPSQTQGAAIDLALGAILPAVGTVVGAVRSQVEAVPDRAPESERAAAAREGAEAGREVAATFLGRAAEDLDHARERRDTVERPLGAFDDLDPIEVFDRNLSQRRVERSADGDAVVRDQQRVEL